MNPVSRTPLSHPCPYCDGKGVVFPVDEPQATAGTQCPACLGDGIETDHRTLRHDEPEDPPYRCWHCGSHKEPYFSRTTPMGHHCPDCGKPDNPTFIQVEQESLTMIRDSGIELAEWAEMMALLPETPDKVAITATAAAAEFRKALENLVKKTF